MNLHTYLNYGGNCAEAFRFYEEHLGAKILTVMKQGEMPGPASVAPENKDLVVHARILVAGTPVMASDVPADRFQPMRSAYLSLGVDSDAEAERIYALLAEGGQVFIQLGETFFASRFAQLRDRFGTLWMIIHERPMPNQG